MHSQAAPNEQLESYRNTLSSLILCRCAFASDIGGREGKHSDRIDSEDRSEDGAKAFESPPAKRVE
jgi:hypothetical protein